MPDAAPGAPSQVIAFGNFQGQLGCADNDPSCGATSLGSAGGIWTGNFAIAPGSYSVQFAVYDQNGNQYIYGGGGHMDWWIVQNGVRKGLRLTFRDEGPGIADIKLAMTDGWTSGNGLGLGLTGSRRLVDEFDIDTGAGRGTHVTIVKWA